MGTHHYSRCSSNKPLHNAPADKIIPATTKSPHTAVFSASTLTRDDTAPTIDSDNLAVDKAGAMDQKPGQFSHILG